jgi:hypothetical protein
MDEDVVAPARAPQLEAERLHQTLHVGEGDVREVTASHPRKEPPRIHNATLPASGDGSLVRPGALSVVAVTPTPAAHARRAGGFLWLVRDGGTLSAHYRDPFFGWVKSLGAAAHAGMPFSG